VISLNFLCKEDYKYLIDINSAKNTSFLDTLMKTFISQTTAGVTSGFPLGVNGICAVLEFYIA
jgi:hypothetical protein